MLKILFKAITSPKMAIITATSIALISTGYWVYNYVYEKGYNACNQQFDAYKQAQEAVIHNLETTYYEQEKKYQKQTEKLVVQISEAKESYNKKLLVIEHDYARKLHESEQRASVYKQMSRDTNNSCNSLADHSAKLDRSLTEGREVVRQLRAIIELRDSQLRDCGKQFQLIGTVNGK